MLLQVRQGEGPSLLWARLEPHHGFKLTFEIEFDQRIRVQDQHRFTCKVGLSFLDSPAGPEDDRFMGVDDPHPKLRAVTQSLLDHRPQIVQIDDDVVKSMPLQQQ